MANISSIRVSGTTYTIKDNSATTVTELTQAQYDALPSSAKTANIFYVITDAEGADLSQYWTSAQTESAITQAVSGKQDTLSAGTGIEISGNVISATGGGGSVTVDESLDSGSTNPVANSAITNAINAKASQSDLTTLSGTVTAHTADTDIHVTTAQTAEWDAKQDALTAGSGITISGNVISATGGGGGSYSAGTNIDITDNTISCTLPITAGTNSTCKGIIIGDSECSSVGYSSIAIGHNSDVSGNFSFCNGSNSKTIGSFSFVYGDGCRGNYDYSFIYGQSITTTKSNQHIVGRYLHPKNELEVNFGTYNNSVSASTTFGDSGNTLFAIGNGYDFTSTHNWHNAFEVRQNGDIYIPNTDDTSVTEDEPYSLYPMVRLQDYLSMKIVKLTESEYTALVTKDSDTLYVVVPDTSN